MYHCLRHIPGLWQSALETRHDILARLCIVHMVHEARGLDMCPSHQKRLHNARDEESLSILDVIYREEITHVGSGMRWFQYVSQRLGEHDIVLFHDLARQHFKGTLKPPFNDEARAEAGFTEEWYLPLVQRKQ